MHTKKTLFATALTGVLGFGAIDAQAAILNAGDLLTLTPGVATTTDSSVVTSFSGSYFVFDHTASGRVGNAAKLSLAPGTDGGIRIGSVQSPGAIDSEPFNLYGSTTTQHYTSAPVSGGTTSGLDFSGWNLHWWNSVYTPMNTGAWTPTNCVTAGVPCTGYGNGMAQFDWSGVYGDAYSLYYTATVPIGDPSGFGGIRVFLHLEGIVMSAVPIPAAAWLMTSGLLGLLGVARRKPRGGVTNM